MRLDIMERTGLRTILMKINFRKLFEKKNTLQDLYPEISFVNLPESKNKYPLFISLESNNIYAYSSRFMIEGNDLLRLLKIIGKYFNEFITCNKTTLSFNNKTLHYYQFEEFGQVVVDIITNDGRLIHDIFSLNLEPPLPNTVFPDRDIESFGSLQGDIEAWWNIYWHPFWCTLSREEKKHYVEQKNIHEELKEFLLLHV